MVKNHQPLSLYTMCTVVYDIPAMVVTNVQMRIRTHSSTSDLDTALDTALIQRDH